MMHSDGSGWKQVIHNGRHPHWHPSELEFIYSKKGFGSNGLIFGDSLFVYHVQEDTSEFIVYLRGRHYDNRYFKYSPDGRKVAFTSRPYGGLVNIWVLYLYDDIMEIRRQNENGTLFGVPGGKFVRRITTEGCSSLLTWSPDGTKICYIPSTPLDSTPEEGTLWIFDLATDEKRQLTFNYTPR